MLRRIHRFHGYNSLTYVYRHGTTVRSEDMSLRYTINQKRSSYRAAVVVGKKVHKSAVVRNRIRRRIFEQLRLQMAGVTKPIDIVITVHSDNVANQSAAQVESTVRNLLQQAGIINSKTS